MLRDRAERTRECSEKHKDSYWKRQRRRAVSITVSPNPSVHEVVVEAVDRRQEEPV